MAACLLEGLLEGAPNGHGLAHALHLGRQLRLGARKLLKSKARNLQAAQQFSDDFLGRCRAYGMIFVCQI